ncbi:MAG: hypothetical protein LAO04_21420 [Acidobacteriia bacterium]|nr:hypothetical protein [Terriglobia bacterium]
MYGYALKRRIGTAIVVNNEGFVLLSSRDEIAVPDGDAEGPSFCSSCEYVPHADFFQRSGFSACEESVNIIKPAIFKTFRREFSALNERAKSDFIIENVGRCPTQIDDPQTIHVMFAADNFFHSQQSPILTMPLFVFVPVTNQKKFSYDPRTLAIYKSLGVEVGGSGGSSSMFSLGSKKLQSPDGNASSNSTDDSERQGAKSHNQVGDSGPPVSFGIIAVYAFFSFFAGWGLEWYVLLRFRGHPYWRFSLFILAIVIMSSGLGSLLLYGWLDLPPENCTSVKESAPRV